MVDQKVSIDTSPQSTESLSSIDGHPGEERAGRAVGRTTVPGDDMVDAATFAPLETLCNKFPKRSDELLSSVSPHFPWPADTMDRKPIVQTNSLESVRPPKVSEGPPTAYLTDDMTPEIAFNQYQRRSEDQACQVCGQPSVGFHHRAYVCEACKVSSFH